MVRRANCWYCFGRWILYYVCQVGKGLNPQEWIQLGSDMLAPVTNDVLAEWDTSEVKRIVCCAVGGCEGWSIGGYGGDSGYD